MKGSKSDDVNNIQCQRKRCQIKESKNIGVKNCMCRKESHQKIGVKKQKSIVTCNIF